MTTMSESGGEGNMAVVPSDTLGRLRSSPEQRTALLAEYKRSGMTAAAFARWSGIKYPTFMAWVAKARRGQNRPSEQTTSPALAAQFIAALGGATC